MVRWAAAEASEMAVPASFNDIAADAAVRDYFGDVWYQRTVWVPRGWQGQRIVLHFESATHRATVWVNEIEVVSHEGGYTPFEVDITDQVTPGEQIRITARVNNTLHWQSIPPGVIEETPAGPRQRYWHDFFNYAGIHRSVWLYATPPAYIADDGHYRSRRRQRCGLLHRGGGWCGWVGARAVLRDADGAEIASADGVSGTLQVRTCTSGRPVTAICTTWNCS